MKTNEEQNSFKEEIETVSKKLLQLNDEELAQVSGGNDVLQKATDLAKLLFQLDKESTRDKAKSFSQKYGQYYQNITTKK